MKEEKLFRKLLEDHHSKVTTPRLTIFRLLLNAPPQSLAELVKQSEGSVNRVSVYRIVEHFEKLGIVRRITIGWKYKIELSELFLYHHHHITCLECGKVVAIKSDTDTEKMIHNLARRTGFSVTSHQLELQGYCGSCRNTV